MKSLFFFLLSIACSAVASADTVVVKVIESQGPGNQSIGSQAKVIENAQVVVFSGSSLEDARFNKEDGIYKAASSGPCTKLWVAGPGYDYVIKKFSSNPGPGVQTISLKPNAEKNSAILRVGELPGIKGNLDVSQTPAAKWQITARTMTFDKKKFGRPVPTVDLEFNRWIDMLTENGQKFRIRVLECAFSTSLVEYTTPK